MFDFLKEEDGHVIVANRIFEMGLLNMFIAEEAVGSEVFHMDRGIKVSLSQMVNSIWTWCLKSL